MAKVKVQRKLQEVKPRRKVCEAVSGKELRGIGVKIPDFKFCDRLNVEGWGGADNFDDEDEDEDNDDVVFGGLDGGEHDEADDATDDAADKAADDAVYDATDDAAVEAADEHKGRGGEVKDKHHGSEGAKVVGDQDEQTTTERAQRPPPKYHTHGNNNEPSI